MTGREREETEHLLRREIHGELYGLLCDLRGTTGRSNSVAAPKCYVPNGSATDGNLIGALKWIPGYEWNPS